MTKKLITLIFSLLITSISHGQNISEDDVDTVNSMVYEKLSKESFIKFNRVTSGGNLSSCELEYQFTYRDFKFLKGKPVLVVGSFSMMYFKGKNVGYLFKIIPTVSDVKTQKWSYYHPQYSDIFFKNQGIEKYKTIEFECDPRGKCVGYSDPDIKLTELLLSSSMDGEIKFSLSKGGLDNSFRFSSIMSKQDSDRERNKFNLCMIEVLDQITKDLETKR